MKKIKSLLAACLLGTMIVTTVGCNSIEKTQEAIDKTVVAKINDENITRKVLDNDVETLYLIETIKTKYGETYEDNQEAMDYLKSEKTRILDDMILEKILMDEIQKRELMPIDEELEEGIQEKLEEIKSQFGDEEEYLAALKEQGSDEENVKEYIKKSLIFQKLQEDILKDVKVPEEAIKDYYDKYKEKYPADTEDPSMLTLAHILVPTEEEALEIKQKLDEGALFEDMAKEYGTDGTKDSGGALGEIPANTTSFDKDFMNGALLLKNGEISEPVKSQFGYHLIQCISRDEKPVQEFDAVKAYIEYELLYAEQSEVINTTIEELKENAEIKTYEDKLI